MKLKEYQLSGGMSCTGVVFWNQGIKENVGKALRMGRNEKKDGIWNGNLQDREAHYTHVTKLMFCVWDFITMRKKRKKRPLESASSTVGDNENGDYFLPFFPP